MRPLPISYKETEAIFQRVVTSGTHRVLFASAEANEGTSTIAYALAQRLAASGRKILFVDFKSSSSYPTRALAMAPSDWDMKSMKQLPIVGIPNSCLSILAAPPEGFHVMDERDRRQIDELFAFWAHDYEFIIGDAPCLVQPSSVDLPPDLLAAAFDHVLLVILSASTSMNAVEAAVRRLREANAEILGVIMNDRELPALKQELLRQTNRIQAFLPRISLALTKRVKRAAVLNVDF